MKRLTLVIVMMTLFIISCSNTRWHEKVVFENKNSKVSLESKEENKLIIKNIYAHPAALKEKSLSLFLKSICYYEETGFFSGKKKAPVFEDYEIKDLATNIKEGLKKADSSQRIHFVSFNRGEGGIFSHLRKTEGVVFIKPAGIINIAFFLVNHEIRPHVNNDPVEMGVKIDPLKARNAEVSVFSTRSEIKNHVFKNGGKSPVWLFAEINGLKSAVIKKEEIKEKKQEEISITRKKFGEKGDKWNAEKEKIRVRLKYIKELFSQGLISKEDYEAKKKELLKQIR